MPHGPRSSDRVDCGTIVQVVVDVSGEPFIDLASEAAAAFARD